MERMVLNVTGIQFLDERNGIDESELWQARDRDPNAREELVNRYQPFARGLALRYHKGPESPDDLIQVAMVGLMHAVDRFDPDSGSKFQSFAAPTITGEVKRYFRDRIWMVRVPRNVQEEIYAVDEAMSELSAELHRTPTTEELQVRANVEDGGVERAIQGRTSRQIKSLDATDNPDGVGLNEMIGSVDPHFGEFDEMNEVNEAVRELDEKARLVLRLRFDEELTQSEIAERVGCSQMHISRVIRKSLDQIQSELARPDST